MFKSFFSKIHAKRMLQIITIVTAVVLTVGVFGFASNGKANAAANPVSINLIYYGTNSNATDQNIINANPEYLVNNSPAGPWVGNADISKFMAAGIKYFDYIDGGYEGTVHQAIPNDVQSNLNYIDAIAAAGAYGVFIDEVSSQPSAAGLSYLKQLADRAHSLGLKVVFNAGVDSWSDSLMEYCDFINSSEVWNNAPLTASQTKWGARTWFLTQGVTDAATAADLTSAAWAKGINASYVCNSYMALPAWLANYITLIEPASVAEPAPIVEPVPTTTPIVEPVITTTPVVEPVVTTTPVVEPVITTIPVVEPVVTTTPVVEPVVIIAPIVEPAPAPTTTAPVVTSISVSNTTGNFFTDLWHSIQGIWDHIVNWIG